MKDLKKQLMAAIAMTLVAAIAMGSSTYAWFASNKAVSASSLEITAVSDTPSLVISTDGSTYAETAVFTVSAATLKLTSPMNLAEATSAAGIKWGYATSTKAGEVQAGNTMTEVTTKAEHVLSTSCLIKMASSTTGSNLKLTGVSLTGQDGCSISNATRILVVTESGGSIAYQMYDPGTSPTITTGTLAATVGTSPITVSIFMYFDGKDDIAYTDAATALGKMSASLSFGID